MPKQRLIIPKPLERKLLYEAARTCCVCRAPRKPVEIHHIDQDPSNNVEPNLIVICRNCHDEAHTKHTMSKNLNADHLRHAKSEWLQAVAQRSAEAMLPSSNLAQAMWTFINHEKLPRILKAHDINFDQPLYQYLQECKAIDPDGIPIFHKKVNGSSSLSTIYDRFEWDISKKIHVMYMKAVDDLIKKTRPLELGALWTKTEFRELVRPGSFCFAIRGFRFQSGKAGNRHEDRTAYARAKNIEVRFHAHTRHMFGSSALYTNFINNSFVAVLMVAKHTSVEGKRLVLHATPLAMGAGFVPGEYHSPHQLRYGWAAG